MTNGPTYHVPPNTTALRELIRVIEQTLSLPAPAAERDEYTYLRIGSDRARLVVLTCRRLLRDHELDDSDVMQAVASIRNQARQLPADQYDPSPLEF